MGKKTKQREKEEKSLANGMCANKELKNIEMNR